MLCAAFIGFILASVAFAAPPLAQADGDPGSDVLLAQNLFTDASFPVNLQLRVGTLLGETAAVGQPVRVAIISARDDLGTVTPLWGRPQAYANYLGRELSDTYGGRLLVVMPGGFGVWWSAHPAGVQGMAAALASVRVDGGSPVALSDATQRAVVRLEAAAGISAATLAAHRGSGPGANVGAQGGEVAAGTTSAPVHGGGAVSPASGAPSRGTVGRTGHGHPDAVLIVIAAVLLLAYIGWRRGIRLPKLRRGSLRGVRVKPIALLPTALLAIVVVALVLNRSSSPATGSLAGNPNLDPGTQLRHPAPAPDFMLADETGRRVSLKQFRGKVVVLAFVDSECQTICPLTTTTMLDAKRALGAAGKDVQLLGVNANWKSTQIDDVLNYTELHGLLGRWHFLTGAPAQLEPIWRAYGVNEQALVEEHSSVIDHVPDIDVIDPQGRLRTVYTESASYAAIPQQAQLLAEDVARLLPSHPSVSSALSYARVKGQGPAQTVSLPRVGGGRVTLKPGKAHLSLFFATWDTQTTRISSHLSGLLNSYARAAERAGLPPLTAIDEGSVEPSPSALPAFLKTLPGPLRYPVAIDRTGRVADGYEVEGEPWFVLTSKTGQIIWYQEVYTSGWPTLGGLEREVRAALAKAPTPATGDAAIKHDLAGSPPPLAALHAQASRLLPGGWLAFYKRIAQLRGHPVVVNIWYSTCAPCQREFGLFANASAQFGRNVAFVGADIADPPALGQAFLRQHAVSYPSYRVSATQLDPLLTGGLQGTPTTLYISTRGKPIYTHSGPYLSQGTLNADIEDYALGSTR